MNRLHNQFAGVLLEQLEERQLMSATVSGLGLPTLTRVSATTVAPKVAVTPLSFAFNTKGLATITYSGTKLFDVNTNPWDGFRVMDYTLIKPDGTSVRTGYVASNTYTSTWNASTQTVTWTFAWGSVSCKYTTAADRLTMKLTITNTSTTDTVAGVDVFPVALRFPNKPASLNGNPNMRFGTEAPPVVTADFGSGTVAVVGEDVGKQAYIGFMSSGSLTNTANRYEVSIGSEPLTYQPNSWPVLYRNVKPGATDTYTTSLRFAATKALPWTMASDVYQKFAANTPMQLTWTDKRPIAELYPSGSGVNSRTATNPNGWLGNGSLDGLGPVDVTTPAGLANFRERLLAYADNAVKLLKDMNGQGMITWDIEGEEYDRAKYIGDPRLATTLAPELSYMNVVNDYFKKFTDAGLRVGVTIRAQMVMFDANGPYQVNATSTAELTQVLIDKIAYAKQQWGATLFYLDSTSPFMDSSVLKAVMQAVPGVLLIPENQNLKDYSISAPYDESRFGDNATPAEVKATYSNSFSIINVGGSTVSSALQTQLNAAVKQGDILMYPGWYTSSASAVVKQAYAAAAPVVKTNTVLQRAPSSSPAITSTVFSRQQLSISVLSALLRAA